jgi:hypothetical protein
MILNQWDRAIANIYQKENALSRWLETTLDSMRVGLTDAIINLLFCLGMCHLIYKTKIGGAAKPPYQSSKIWNGAIFIRLYFRNTSDNFKNGKKKPIHPRPPCYG